MIAGALLGIRRKHYNRLPSGLSLYRLFRLSHGLGLSFLFIYTCTASVIVDDGQRTGTKKKTKKAGGKIRALHRQQENEQSHNYANGGHFERAGHSIFAELSASHWPNHQKYKRNQNGAVSTNPATMPVMIRLVSPVIAMVFYLQGID